jgi:ribosome maturation factor RimP
MTLNTQQKIEALVLPILERMGYKLWGCQCQFNQNQRLIRIFIDKSEGIQLTDCEQVSHAVSAALDVEDMIVDQYRLEISSPGLPKPLFYPWQYQENLGTKIKVKLIRLVEGHRWLQGEIIAANENELTIAHDGVNYQIAWSNISKAFIDNE